MHTLILCKIWQYEINHLKSQICTFTGCMSDHLLSLSTTQWDAPPYHSCTFFFNFSKGWEDVGYSNQWYMKKIGEVTMSDCIGIKCKTKILNKNSDLRLILDFNCRSFGPLWTGAPRDLVHLVTCATCFLGTQTNMLFFCLSQKVLPVCWVFN